MVLFPYFTDLPIGLVVLLAIVFVLKEQPNWILVLMLGSLPLINVLSDWLSFGLIRRLLRVGQRKGGLWPLLYVGIDLTAAVGLLFGLVMTCLLYVEGFNLAAVDAGGPVVLDVNQTLRILRSNAWSLETLWIYITIFTKFIPSLVNLCLGALMIVRGMDLLHKSGERFLAFERRCYDGWEQRIYRRF